MSAPPAAAPALRFAGVSKWYGQVAALMDVSFAIGAQVVGLVGRNGAGKSTLMKLACGLLAPSQGEVEVVGVPAGTPEARARLGFCPDVERLYERCSGLQFVAWMLRLHGAGAAGAQDRAAEVLTELGLAADMERPIREYSKGMRQRVRLAQALAHRPAVVLLDEPMNGLDPVARHELAGQIARLARSGTAVLISSHVLHELETMVDRVVLVHQGRLLAEGRVAELRGQVRGQPHRVQLGSERPRELAAQLVGWPQVQGLELAASSVQVAVNGEPGFYGRLTGLGASADGLVHEVTPLDDSLASVFGYLIG
ncbi:MAG: ABC transporter ATP-binding protein [Planctomycetes bacterium]|nr:ABC transporter ATP-binding protein [Planctomycetota bacterium]